MADKPLKIVMCGPTRSGKTSIANFIAGRTEQLGHPEQKYEPTVGARILECEKQPGIAGGKINIELWDVSGDQNFEACWPGVMKDADGVVLVYNPEVPSHQPELGIWYDHFVKGAGLDDEHCQVLVHRTDPTPAPRTRPPPKLQNVGSVVNTNFASVTQVINAFDDFLQTVMVRDKGGGGGGGGGAGGRSVGFRK